MRSPSVEKLIATFDLDPAAAKRIKRLCAARDSRDELRALVDAECPATAAYARSCYNSPYTSRMWRTTLVLHAVNEIVGGFGVQAVDTDPDDFRNPPPVEFINMGDPYTSTLLYRHASDNLYIGAWGDCHEVTRGRA